ncbi:MAG: methyltransferase domain-containing protein [Desulfobulbaceae bacterium]|nr:methyltransferase domain-containing protein [Desulfobulbaceae bacterium]
MTDFYEANCEDYFHSTVDIEPSSFLYPLADILLPGAKVLDIGCGSGRDLRWLSERGFKPTGFERSPNLAAMARRHSHCPVIEGDFCRYDFSSLQFDALVLVGALVHLSKPELPAIFRSICQALVQSGCVLLTLKEGSGSKTFKDGRVFTLWSREELESIFADINLEIVRFTRSTSKLRIDDVWLGYVLRLVDGE